MFYHGKKVLVTGGAGFVGSHLVEELLREGAQVRVAVHHRPLPFPESGSGLSAATVGAQRPLPHSLWKTIETIKADLTRPEDCRAAARGTQFVFHAAGAVGAAGVGASGVMSGITTNLILTAQMLEAAWAEGVERFLLFGSSTGYPAADHPVKEEEMWAGPPHPAYLGYGWMRRYAERLGEFVASSSPMKVALVRPTAVYGRRDNFDPKTSHVIPALIRRALAKENPFVVWGTGNEVRDFLHVTDLARGCVMLLEKHAACDAVNIGYGKTVTIRDIVQIILKAAGHERAELKFDTTKPTMIPIRSVDTSKAKRVLGFEPQLTLEEGLADTVRWYQEQSR